MISPEGSRRTWFSSLVFLGETGIWKRNAAKRLRERSMKRPLARHEGGRCVGCPRLGPQSRVMVPQGASRSRALVLDRGEWYLEAGERIRRGAANWELATAGTRPQHERKPAPSRSADPCAETRRLVQSLSTDCKHREIDVLCDSALTGSPRPDMGFVFH